MLDANNNNRDPISELEARLRSWEPSAEGLDRDRMLFQAGRADARKATWGASQVWQSAAAAAALLAAGLGFGWAHERSRSEALQLTIAQQASDSSAAQQAPASGGPGGAAREPIVVLDPSSYLTLLRQAEGLDSAVVVQPATTERPSATGNSVTAPSGAHSLRPRDFDRITL
jgi:hypothetical protein